MLPAETQVAAPRPALDAFQLRILWGGLLLVSLGVLGTRLSTGPLVRFFDNLHWTAGYATSALLAWTGWRRVGHGAQRYFFWATTAYLIGQLLWDVQVAAGWNPFPGPSDLFFATLGPLLAIGLARELRGMSGPALSSAGLDLLGLAAAALAHTLARYLPVRGSEGPLITATLVAYPVFLWTALGAGVIVVLSRRLRLTPALALLLAAMLVNALIWSEWNLKTLEKTLGDGILLNYCFSYAAIALGIGAALWSPRETDARTARAYYLVSNSLPILLAVGAGVALQRSPDLASSVAAWVGACSLLIVVCAVLRQGLAVAERDQRLAAERRERALADQYRTALARQEQAQRLESLGTLSAGIAHDFNNLLMAIRAQADLVRLDATEAASAWEAVRRACERGAGVVHSLLAFGGSRPGAEPRVLALGASVQESLRLLRAVIPSSVSFVTEIADATPQILADPSQVQQILINLTLNAAHAIGPHAGRISLRTESRVLEASHGLPPGRYAALIVSDDGVGMDEETRRRVFEPFFSTKGPLEGTGMGLAVVHGIVAAAGGGIECESAPGQGARFTLLWPAASEGSLLSPEPASAQRPPFAMPQGAEVLVVDDEAVITRSVSAYLRRMGLRAVACNSAQHALSLVRDEPRRFAAVVCDMTMPDLSGDVLCRAIRGLAPGLPVVLSSGTESEPGPHVGFAAVLIKPYALEELARVLSRLLSPPAA